MGVPTADFLSCRCLLGPRKYKDMQIREKMKARALSCSGLSVMNVSVWDTAPW